jgi:hypothetical protein
MSSLTEAIHRIIKCLQQDESKLASSLMPGITRAEIEKKVKDLPLQLPQEIWEIYQTIRGFNRERLYDNLSQQTEPNMFIFDGYALLSLEEVVEIYNEKQKLLNQYYDSARDCYSSNWIQIFFCYICENEGYVVIDENPESCSVIFMCKREEKREQYTSLTSMMLTLAEFYESGYRNNLSQKEFYEIWRKYNSSLVDAVLTKLTDEISYESLVEIAADLMKFKDASAVEPLIRILQKPASNSDDLGRQELAARILGEIGDTRAVEPLIHALQEEYWLTRHWAAVSLGQLKDVRAIEPLTETLQDTREEVRQKAAWALGELGQ